MYVRNEMTKNPITVNASDMISKASDLMTEKNLHRIPVLENGKLVGLVTKGLITSKGIGGATSLSIFELNYLLNKTSVKTVMIKLKDLVTIGPDELLEEAAQSMLKHDIGCLPVLENDQLVGILTQNDLFKAFLDILGWDQKGSRIAVNVKDGIGVIGEISKVFVKNNADITHIGVYRNDTDNCDVIIRTNLVDVDDLSKDLNAAQFKTTSTHTVK